MFYFIFMLVVLYCYTSALFFFFARNKAFIELSKQENIVKDETYFLTSRGSL